MAACTPINPTNGATVTCSGAANPLAPSYASSANNLTVNMVPGGSTGVLLGLGGTAMSLTGNGTTLNNAGTIDPSLFGLLSLLSSGAVIGNPNLGAAIPGSTVNVSNLSGGVMKGTTGLLGLNLSDLTGMALSVRNGGGGTTTINNAGTIDSSALLGVSLLGSDAPVVAAYGGGKINFTNTGTIIGRTTFESSAAGNTFINAGTISGSVSMGTNSTNTFTAVTGSSVSNGGSLGLNLLGVLGINLSFAPTGQIDGGAGGNNTLVLQNVVAGPGSGAAGTGTASSATYINFQHLTVNSGTWSLQGALVSGDTTLNGGVAKFDSDANFGSAASITANGGGVAASTGGATLSKAIMLNAGGLYTSGANNFTLSGVLSGSGALINDSTLTGGGPITLTLIAANAYTGGTIIKNGAVALGANGSLAATGMVNLQNTGSTFDIAGANANQTIGMLVGDLGTTVALGARTLTFGDSTNSTFFGAITGTGGIVKQGSGVFTMGGANTYTGGTTISAGTLQVTDASSLGTGTITINNARLASTSSLSTNNAINVNGNVTISAVGNLGPSGGISGSGNLTMNSGTFSVGGNVTINGPLSVTTTAGSITQTAGIFTVSGASTFSAVGNAITLTALNAFGGTVNLTGGTTQITNSGNLTLGTLNTGALTVFSMGALNLGSGSVAGALTATSNSLLSEGSGGLNVTGLASFTQNGGGADIDLSQANNFQGGVTISGAAINNLSLKNTSASPGALTLPGSVAGNLTLNYTNAGLTLPVVGVGGALDASAGGGITINGNVGTGAAQAYHSAVTLGADAILASTGNGNIGFDSTVNGAYALTVNTGGTTSFGGTVGGTTALTSLTTNAGGSTTLGSNVTTSGAQTYNDVVTLGGDAILASTSGGDIHLASTIDGAHKLSVSTGGAATFGGAVGSTTPLTSLTTNSGTFSAAGTLRIGSGGLSVTTNGGGIAQSGAFTVAGVSNFNAGTNAITLTNAGNSFTGEVSLTNSGLNNVALINGGLLTLGNVAVSSGTLSLTGNGIAQSASTAVTQAPGTGAVTLNAGTGALTLANSGNHFTGAVSATGTGITLYDGGNLTLSSLSNGSNGAVDLQAAGILTLPTTAIATGTSNLRLSSGATLTTPGDLSGANLTLSGDAGVTVANNVTTGGNLTLMSSGGAISNAAGMLAAGTLTGHSTGATTLTGPNQIGSLDAFTANSFTLTNAQALTVTGAVSGGTGATTLTTTGAGSDLNVAATGSINGGAVSLAAGGGMSLAGNVSGATVDLSASGTMLLTGTIASTDGTTVRAGKLEVGDATRPGASVTGNVAVNSGATLGGHGTIGGDVALASGAHLAPGGSIGTLTIGGNASFAQGSVLDYEFGAPGATFTSIGTGDSVKVGGNLTLNGAILNVTNAGGFGPGLYNLFTWGGSLIETNGGIVLGTIPAGDALVIQNLTGTKQINLLDTTGLTLNLWNGNGLANVTQMGGGSGTWTTTSPNWTDATGSVSAAMQPQPGFAIFGGTPGTVAVDNGAGNVNATGMQFASNGYTLTGGTLSLVGSSGNAPIIRVGDGSSAGAAMAATINNVIAGSDGLTKSDLGTLVLTGANTYSGNSTISGGTLEAANNSALGSGSVTVDNTGNQGATLKVDSGITLANTIAINNGGTLDNAGTISHTGATEVGVNATGGMAMVANHDGGNIAGGVIGLWLHTGGTVINTGNTSRIDGAGYALVTDGSPDSVVTNENGASIHGSTQDSVLMIQGGTLINQSGASISGDSVAVRMSQSGTIINQSGASISGTGASSYGVILHQGGTITNQGGATIQGGDTGIALAGASTITNAAGSSVIGGNTSVSVFGSGAVNLTNAGLLSGSVYLNSGDTNAVTLISGGSLNGNLYIGSNTNSTLTLDGIGAQLYSSAVTGTTGFAGTLTKQGAGSWVVDSDLTPTATLISAGTLQIGNGGTSGSLGGDINNNAALVSNLSGAGTLAGAISGSGSLTQDGSGVLTLTGANSYTGGTTISAGTLQGDTTSLQGNITDNAMLAFNQANAGTFAGVVSGSGTLNKLGNGTLTLTGTNTHTGGTTISAGTLQLGNGGTAGSISGNVIDNGTLAFDRSDALIFGGTVTGSGALVQNGSGTLILTGANGYTGGTTISAGTLQGDTTSLQGNITNNAALVFNQVTAGIYAGAISGTGALTKTGAGTLTFNGSSPFSGATTVTGGKLVIGDDSHAGASLGGMVTVASGATLGGIGTIGGLNLAGTVTPGNSIGTLHVAGNATFQQGSSYQIEAAPNGSSDQIAATGKVTILGGSAVVLAQAGNWVPRTDYAIITGAQGVSGQFASASSSLLFLDPALSYTANAVNLSLQRNDISFASVAQTPNQLAVATVTNDLGFASPMYVALTTLDASAARHAFDQLSGAIHAGTTTALVDDSRYVREAINRHLLGLNDGTEGTTAQGVSVWTSIWGHGGHHDDDGNAASLQANGSGLLIGADLSLGSNSRLGAVVGHGQNSIRENSLGSSAHVLGDHVGVYGSSTFGSLVLRGGMAYARQNVRSNRAVAFGNYSDWLGSEHHAQTAQAYVEGGYQFSMSPGQQLEPFVNVARVRVHSDALQEGGGNAALAVAGNSASVNTATLGLRDTLTLDAAGGIHAHASLGWQQAWGDLAPVTTMRFVTGGTSFAVAGMPVARHALTTDLGVGFKLARNVSVDASYVGQFASGVQDQGARMSLTVAF